MNISELSIRRPVLSTVLTLAIILFGIIGYTYLGVREYPSVDNPIISVSTSYPGANADVVENQITEPLEQNINGIPGIRSLSSVSSQGSSNITVEFQLSVDLETAANDVRDKVSRSQRLLPRDCDPPIVTKADADAMPILMVAIRSDKRSLLELSEIADLTVKEQLQTISDVSSVSIWGEKRYSMRLWLDPIKMSGYGITPLDVRSAIERENIELPSGSIEGNTTELTIRTLGLMHTAEEFNNLIVKEDQSNIVRFRDIGRAELGPQDIRSYMKMDGIPMIGVVVTPQPGANHIEIADAVYDRMKMMEKDLPEDITYTYGFDNTKFIRASINGVKETVYIAFILVIFIIFVFLRDWRVTLIPCIVIPVSLVGAFFVMYLAGFSINVLSMLAIVLAIGLVVDDAIVMTENIYIRVEKGMTPKQAGIEGAKEIFFAIISTTITLISVFFPIVFMEGMTGRLFREFSIVVSGSVIISSFAALTFTPMLATKLLVRREKKNWLYTKTEPFFVGMNNFYRKSLSAFLKNRLMAIPVIVITILAIIFFWNEIPSEMAPLEDRSQITINTRGAEGVTYEYIRDYTEDIVTLVDSVFPLAKSVQARVGGGSGNVRIVLDDINERDYSQMEVAAELSQAVRTKTKARAFVQQQTTFGGRRGAMPVQYVIQSTNIEKLQEIIPVFLAKVQDNPLFQMADVNLKFNKPETRININREKASIMGVSTQNIAQTLQYALSGQRMGYFYMNGKQYEILGEINRQQRNKPADLKSIYIRSSKGEMIQLDNLVELSEGIAPPQLYRYNRFVAATVSSGLAVGRTIGEGLDEMDIIAKETLDDTFRTALTGDSKEFKESSSSLMFAFLLAILFIYLVLAAQFESFKDPLIIMFSVPLAVAGALLFMYFNGITMNIYSQIGIIMLIGLVAKNGILIVEFANQKQEAGIDKATAIRDASLQRLRPILMTSASTILGLIPLAFATGEGCNGQIAMGVSVVGGLLVSTLLTMYIVPAMYSYISTNRANRKKDEYDNLINVEI
ncbi:MAG: efflux RND transporter permease subunit [Prevotellaceae bacterium]|jgi:multidrug efflux pump|nr:efflux RND transporter permease subunit [Prevotellaceae bacterium]